MSQKKGLEEDEEKQEDQEEHENGVRHLFHLIRRWKETARGKPYE